MKVLKYFAALTAFFVFPTVALFSVPKYPFMEKLLNYRNLVFIKAQQTEEGLNGLTYLNGKIYAKGLGEVAEFSRLNLKVFSLPKLTFYCQNAENLSLYGSVNGKLNMEIKNLDCSKYAETINGKLQLGKRTIYGNLDIKNLKVQNLGTVNRINLRFKGDKLEGFIVYGNEKLIGGGSFKFNLLNPLKTYLNLTFTGKNLKIHIEGYLENPRIRF